jgi:hydrogenase maturation protease
MNIVLLGIGQSLRGDDGIGPESIRRWSRQYPSAAADPRVKTRIKETPGLDLLDDLEQADAALIVDAVSTGAPPGTIHILPSVPETGMSAAEKTAHGFGVAETLAVARRTGRRLPGEIRLIGIEGADFNLGSGFSEPVRNAVPDAVRAIHTQITAFLGK